MKKIISSGLALGAMISLVGCGGGSSSSTPATVSGQFIDAAVAGLNYECASSGLSGVTDDMGTFTCRATDDNVTFSIGAYVIGSSNATSGIVTPYSLYPDNEEAAIDVAQLLQSLDSDEDGVITIPEGYDALDDVNATPGDTEANFEDEVTAAIAPLLLVDEPTAQDSMDENILMELLGGKTLYIAEEGIALASTSFDTNLTEMNLTAIAGEATSGIKETMLQNGGLQVQDLGFLVLTEKTDDYILFSYGVDQTVKFYFDEAQAKAVYEGYIFITEEKLSAQSFYLSEEEYDNGDSQPKTGDLYTKLTFSNGTVTIKDIWESATDDETGAMTSTAPYELIDGKLRVDVSGLPNDSDPFVPEGYFWLTLDEVTLSYWFLLGQDDADKDGEIDNPSQYDGEAWYFKKPEGFPADL